MKRLVALSCLLLLSSVPIIGCIGFDDGEIIKILHAGSLSGPFSELERKFEEEYPDMEVRREMAGSVETVRKITDQGQEADIVGVADYSLISDLMYDDYASWTIEFATNSMALAYTEDSNHADEITSNNWFEILQREDVKIGFSSPNHDPCGYRSQMVIRLAQEHYEEEDLFEKLIEGYTDIREEDGQITVPENLNHDASKIMVRPAEMELIYALETGDIDYLFIYQSVVQQHENLDMVSLPPEIDLGSPELAEFYGNVSLTMSTGKTIVAQPIVYGITIPTTVRNVEGAEFFIEFLLSESGKEVIQDMGQDSIDPAIVDNIEELPEELRGFVLEKNSGDDP